MRFKQWIPSSVKNRIRLNNLRKKYPYSKIETVNIGTDVLLGEHSAVGTNCDIRSQVTIGGYSYVNPGTIIASGTIGKYCSIGYMCQIGMFEHPINHISTSPNLYHKDRSVINIHTWDEIYSPPIIGNDVWIGSNVIILQGVTIGNGAIIAGGAVVTKDVQPYSVVGGVPAKEIKKRFNKEEIFFLESLKWWDLPIEDLVKYKNHFEAKEKWVELIPKS